MTLLLPAGFVEHMRLAGKVAALAGRRASVKIENETWNQ
jgi:hypothetical protein